MIQDLVHRYIVQPIINKDPNLFIDDINMYHKKVWEVEHTDIKGNRSYYYFNMKKDINLMKCGRTVGQKTYIEYGYWSKYYPEDLQFEVKSNNPKQQLV